MPLWPSPHRTRRALLGAVVSALTGALLVGCGAGGKAVDLDPMRFEVVRSGDQTHVESLDDKTLFREGGAAYEKADYDAALRKYTLIVERLPDSRYATIAGYNAGLSLLRMKRYEDAAPWFERTAKRTAGSKDAHDALFHLATCHEKAGDWKAMAAAMDRVLKPEWEGIKARDHIEAHSRRGQAREKLGEAALAERDYLRALRLYRRNLADRALYRSEHVAFAQYRIGEIYSELFRAVRFQLPVARMDRDLADKSNYFLKAQNAYLKTLRLRNARYAIMAGYRLGEIYERFYDDFMAAEVPDHLNREELEVYYDELKKEVKPFISQALDIYARNLRMAQRMGDRGGKWVRMTEQSVSRLKEVLRQEATAEAQARLEKGAD